MQLANFQVETNPAVVFKTHPNINKELFSNENILGLKDSSRAFPINQPGDGVSLLRWRMQSGDESLVPISSETLLFRVLHLFIVIIVFWFIDIHSFLSQLTAGLLFLGMRLT